MKLKCFMYECFRNKLTLATLTQKITRPNLSPENRVKKLK